MKLALVALLALFVSACGGGNKGKLEGRKSDDILEQKAEFLALYMDENGIKKFGLDGQPFVHDPVLNKIYWRVMECIRPTCSGRIKGKSHLFIVPDNAVSVDDDGAIIFVDSFNDSENVLNDGEYLGETLIGLCPKCEKGILNRGVTQFGNDGLKVSDQIKLEKKKLKQYVKPYYAEDAKPSVSSVRSGTEIQKK